MGPPPLDPMRLSLGANGIKTALTGKRKPPPRPRSREWFLKGPIPGEWISKAASLGGRSLRVALALWCEAGMRRRKTVRLSAEMQRRFSICARTCKFALRTLSKAKLVSVRHSPGKRPEVTIEDFRG